MELTPGQAGLITLILVLLPLVIQALRGAIVFAGKIVKRDWRLGEPVIRGLVLAVAYGLAWLFVQPALPAFPPDYALTTEWLSLFLAWAVGVYFVLVGVDTAAKFLYDKLWRGLLDRLGPLSARNL